MAIQVRSTSRTQLLSRRSTARRIRNRRPGSEPRGVACGDVCYGRRPHHRDQRAAHLLPVPAQRARRGVAARAVPQQTLVEIRVRVENVENFQNRNRLRSAKHFVSAVYAFDRTQKPLTTQFAEHLSQVHRGNVLAIGDLLQTAGPGTLLTRQICQRPNPVSCGF